VDVAAILKDAPPTIAATAKASRSTSAVPTVIPKPSEALSQQITALLFADAVGFSRLAEEEIPYFVCQFLGKIAVLLATTSHAPVLRATWGDGLYFVFDNVESAGSFALDLKELVANTDWIKLGLPSQLGLRIALHAGPTYRCVDPVSGRQITRERTLAARPGSSRSRRRIKSTPVNPRGARGRGLCRGLRMGLCRRDSAGEELRHRADVSSAPIEQRSCMILLDRCSLAAM